MEDPLIANKRTYWESNGQVTRRMRGELTSKVADCTATTSPETKTAVLSSCAGSSSRLEPPWFDGPATASPRQLPPVPVYRRFKIAELPSAPATLATVATVHPANTETVASAANVADPEPKTTLRAVPSINSYAGWDEEIAWAEPRPAASVEPQPPCLTVNTIWLNAVRKCEASHINPDNAGLDYCAPAP